jgi:GT2 family glycosyltransferase/lipopolysaccharide/colanic/teichoic acid biosynthesis glycosyltransferase
MTLSVVVVSYNVREFVSQCLLSLYRSRFDESLEIILVDNNSSDNTVGMVRERYPDVIIIENQKNRGFAAAVNQGVAASSGQIILLLNPDTIVEENTVRILTAYLQANPDVGCVGPKILNSDGSLQQACKRSFPSPWVALTRLLGLSRLFPGSRLFGRYNLTYLDPDETHRIEAVSGSCMCIPRSVWDTVGNMDDEFFLFGEDLDYCYRIHQAGFQVVYLPETHIIHYKGESVKTAPFDNLRMFHEAMVTFSRKYDSFSGGILTRTFIRMGIALRSWWAYLRSSLATFSSLIIDTLVIGSAFFVMISVRFLPDPHFRTSEMLVLYLPVVAVYVILWLGIGAIFQIYGRYVLSYSRALVASLVGFLLIATLTYFYREVAYSRIVLVAASALVAGLLPGWRLILHLRRATHKVGDSYRAHRPSIFSRRAVVLGTHDEGKRVAGLVQRRPDTGIDLLGFIIDDTDTVIDQDDLPLPIIGRVMDFHELVAKYRFQEVIIASDNFTYERLMDILEQTRDLPLLYRIVPRLDEVMLGKANVEYIGDLPFVSVEASLYHRFHLLSKRLFDILTSGMLILFLFPIWPIALIVFGLQSMEIWYTDHNKITVHIFKRGSRGFRRIPLLWSVFWGRISLVGGAIVSIQEPDPNLLFKPGITGLSQLRKVDGAFEITQSYDRYYLQHQSFTFDLEILLKAVFKI